jgi:two-component system, response regulator / RNA-binding antiterminator
LDARQRAAQRRDADVDERERLADERERLAHLRDRALLGDLAAARLQARLETMPVIEQAKGVIIEQEGCTAEQAFDLLRKASQRSNVPVRELAVLIVARSTRRSWTATCVSEA